MTPFMFLFKLAWESRFRLPLIITLGFMIMDVRMQLEVDINPHRRPRRIVAPPRQFVRAEFLPNQNAGNDLPADDQQAVLDVEDQDSEDQDNFVENLQVELDILLDQTA